MGRGAPWGLLGWSLATVIPLGFLVLFFVWPVMSLLATGFVENGRVVVSGIPDVFLSARTWSVIGQTLLQAVGSTVLSVVIGVPAAYVLYKLDFPGRTAVHGFLTIPFVLPTVVVGVAFTALLGPGGPLEFLGLDRSFVTIVAAMAFFNVTVVARTVGSFWARLDDSATKAAQVLGASQARAWVTMTLPALRPALASAAALVFLFSSTSFGIVLILGGREFSNVETEIYRLTVQFLDLKSAAILSIVQFAIVGLTLFVSARLRTSGERAVQLRADQQWARRPARSDIPVLMLTFASVFVLHVLPICTLIARSFQGDEGEWTLAHYAALFDPKSTLPIEGTMIGAIGLSLRIALSASIISMVLGILIALVLSRRPTSRALVRGQHLFDSLVMLPLGVSAVTLGFGLLLTMHSPLGIGFDLRTSIVLIPIAQALVALPLVVRTLLPVLRAIDHQLKFAAQSLGASPLVVLRTVDLPMMGRSAGLALGFAFATSLGEFGATSFLVRPGEQTLPVVVAELIGHQAPGSYGAGLAGAVLLGILSAGVMLIADRFRTDQRGVF